MNIWVCDDQLISARELKKLLETFPDINAKIFTDLSEMINTLDSTDSCPDSLIIDIDFYGKPKGLSAGNIIQKRFPYIPVLFATAYSESYAQLVLLDCPGAFGYLTKPYSVSVLSRYLEKLRAYRDSHRSLTIKQKGHPIDIPESIILYIESYNHRADIHTSRETVSVYEKLSDLQLRLSGNFFVCHQSYIVNLDHVVSCSNARIALDDGTEIPISRKYKKSAQARFYAHLQQRMEESF